VSLHLDSKIPIKVTDDHTDYPSDTKIIESLLHKITTTDVFKITEATKPEVAGKRKQISLKNSSKNRSSIKQTAGNDTFLNNPTDEHAPQNGATVKSSVNTVSTKETTSKKVPSTGLHDKSLTRENSTTPPVQLTSTVVNNTETTEHHDNKRIPSKTEKVNFTNGSLNAKISTGKTGTMSTVTTAHTLQHKAVELVDNGSDHTQHVSNKSHEAEEDDYWDFEEYEKRIINRIKSHTTSHPITTSKFTTTNLTRHPANSTERTNNSTQGSLAVGAGTTSVGNTTMSTTTTTTSNSSHFGGDNASLDILHEFPKNGMCVL